MIPIRDVNPSLTSSFVTFVLIGISVAVFLFVQPRNAQADIEFTYERAAIACEVTTGEPLSFTEINDVVCRELDGNPAFPDKSVPISIVVSMFLHAGFLHLAGNMWSLWIFGNNVEDAFGSVGYVLLYFFSGVVATLAFVALNPNSTVPLVGASGAIAGVMGAYLVLYPRARVVSVFPLLFFIPLAIPASIFLAFWFFGQFALIGGSSGIAWEAHVGGFVFGAVIALVLRGPLLARVERLRQRAMPSALRQFSR